MSMSESRAEAESDEAFSRSLMSVAHVRVGGSIAPAEDPEEPAQLHGMHWMQPCTGLPAGAEVVLAQRTYHHCRPMH